MAVVLDAFTSYIQNMLTEMAREEVGMLLGVSGEIDNMKEKLQSLKDYLADAERKRITDQHVQGWVRKLKDVMYDATDILELCQLEAMDQPQGASFAVGMGCCSPLLFCLPNPLFAHDIGSRIKKLNQRLDDIYKMGAGFNFINLETYQDRRIAQAQPRQEDQVLDRLGVVGEKIEEDTKALVEKLMTKVEGAKVNNDDIMVVAIVGVGGIGKTTLAKKIFNDEAIQHKFNKKIWLSVTQDFDQAELLRTAITAANGDLPGAGTRDRSLLAPALVNAIKDKVFFLVLDDIWSEGEWNNLLRAPFSYGAPGSQVLVTTRDERVARGMKAMRPYHQVDKLGDEDAWSLLKKQIVSSEQDEHEVDMLKDIGAEIIARCGGLPLAIKVMGGLLCQKEKRRGDWEKVLNDSIWSISGLPEQLNHAIYLSYEDLPPYMKQCFLHFSLLPKNTKNIEFSDITIVSMWISEGFLHANSDESEELGIKCYKELILRNLIEPDTRYADQWVCNMHDVVRSFAQYVAKDEALVTHNRETLDIISKHNSHKFRRLSIETKGSELDEFEWSILDAQESLRTLISIGQLKIKPGDSLITFSRLRTLHIESANVAALVESVYQLKHLRYMSLRYTDISGLSENISKMQFLQYISLHGCESFVKLPRSIVKLGQLSYLNLIDTSINSIPRGFGGLTNLRQLRGFQAHMDGGWCSLEELGPLSKLRILGLKGLEKVSAASFAANARLGEKVHLTELVLRANRLGDGVSEEEGEVPSEGEGDGIFEEEGEGPSEEEGEGLSVLSRVSSVSVLSCVSSVSEKEGDGVSEGEGDGVFEGEGDGLSEEEGDGLSEGEGDGIFEGEGYGVSKKEQRRIEGVFNALRPPPCLDHLVIRGYFGQRLPMWMMSIATTPLNSLRILMMKDLACCTQLPNGLCQLPCLQRLHIENAPAIKRVSPEFLQPYHHHRHHPSCQAVVVFSRLHTMKLRRMVEWEEWEWEEQVQAMPVLEELLINSCKLRRVPPGLASHARALKKLRVRSVQHLNSLENFVSLIELKVSENPDLKRITHLPKLQKLRIIRCPKLKVLEGMLALQRLELWDFNMKTLPGYLQDVKPRHLEIHCSLELLTSIAEGESSPEWERLNHIQHVKAYAHQRKWYVLYTRDPYNLETNISRFTISGGDEEEYDYR